MTADLLKEHEDAFDILAELHRKAIAEGRPGYYREMQEKARMIARMEERELEYKPTKFCWWCSRKLWGNKHVIKEIDGLPRTMHVFCSRQYEKEKGYVEQKSLDTREKGVDNEV